MEFSEVLQQRSSIRDFSDRPVEDELLESLLAKSLAAPSWSNTQPYRIAIARGAVRDRLARELTRRYEAVAGLQGLPVWRQALQGWLKGSLPDGDFKPILKYPAELQARRVETGKGLYQHLGIARQDRAARDAQMALNFSFFGAPVALFVFIHEGLGVYSALDAGIFLQSFMLAATDVGLGTCAQGALAMWRSPVAKEFEIPEHYQLLCGVALGYPSDHPVNRFSPAKRPLSELLLAEK